MISIADVIHSKKPLTRGQEIKFVLMLAWPCILEQIMITMMQYIDTAMVGSLGANATASIGTVSSTIWLFNGILGAAGVGFSVQVAQHLGAKRADKASDVAHQALKFNLFFGLIIGAIAVAISFVLPQVLGAEQALLKDSSLYFAIVGASMPFLLTENLFAGILRCTGDTKTPMFLNIMICVFDVIFNYLLIYPTRTIVFFGKQMLMPGMGLGVVGAALGSALSITCVSLILLIVMFVKNTPVKLYLKNSFKLTKSVLKNASSIGVPVALERAALNIAQIFITMIIAGLGTVSMASNHLAVTAEALSYLPAYGIAAAATTLVGQAIGAKREDLAMRFAVLSTKIGIIFMSITGACLFVFAPYLIKMFTADVQVIALGSKVLRIVAFAQPLFAAAIVVTGALRGAGDSRMPFIINLVSMWGVRITAAVLLAPYVGLVGVWLAMSIELCVRGIVFLLRLKNKKWLHSHRLV